MKKVKSIELVFENCEVVSLTPAMFEALMIEGVTARHWINCFQYEAGEDYSGIDCERFSVAINKQGQEIELSDSGTTLKERVIRFNDITHVNLLWENGEKEYITVPWRGDYQENEAQKTKMYEGELVIEIKKSRGKEKKNFQEK